MMEETTMEELCAELRADIEALKKRVCTTAIHPVFMEKDMCLDGANIPASRQGNMKANLTLVFRHLEDARMRLGKVMQASQGGISILDKK